MNDSVLSHRSRTIRILYRRESITASHRPSLTFEEHHNRHRIALPERKVGLEPGHHGTRFHTRLELAAHREPLIRREPAELRGALTRFPLNVLEKGLKSNGSILRWRRGE